MKYDLLVYFRAEEKLSLSNKKFSPLRILIYLSTLDKEEKISHKTRVFTGVESLRIINA